MNNERTAAGPLIDPAALIQDDATVEDNALIRGGAILKGKATISGKAYIGAARAGGVIVGGSAVVTDNAAILSSTTGIVSVGGNAKILGKAKIKNAVQAGKPFSVGGNAIVSGNAELGGLAIVMGNAKVFEKALVRGKAQVMGDAKVHGNAVVSGEDTVIMGKADIGGTATIMGGVWDGSEGKITAGTWGGPDKPLDEKASTYRQMTTRPQPEYLTPAQQAAKDKAEAMFLRRASSNPQVRKELLRMAKVDPKLRTAMLKMLVKKACGEGYMSSEEAQACGVMADDLMAGRTWGKPFPGRTPDDSVPYNKHPNSPDAGTDGSEQRKKYNQWFRENVCPDHKTNCGMKAASEMTAEEMLAGRTWDGDRSKPDDAVPYNKHPDSPDAGADGSEQRRKYNQWFRENVCPGHKTNCGL